MTERIDMHEPIAEICRRLGLDPTQVSVICVTPTAISVRFYLLDASGKLYVQRGEPAHAWRTFEVWT
jgi:hypothetical protein